MVVILITLTSTTLWGQAPKEKEITLKEAILNALKYNLDLQVKMMDLERSSKSLVVSKGIFIPEFEFRFEHKENNRATSSILDGSEDVETSKTLNLSATISQKLGIGGTLSVNLNNTRSESNNIFTTVNPNLYSTLNFNLSQPLLKNFGTFITRKNIIIAQNDNKISQLDLKQQILDLVYQVEDAYWSLVYAYRNKETVQMTLERSRDLMKQNELKVKVGIIPQIDALDAQADVARNESSLIQAEQGIQNAEEKLKQIMNMSRNEAIFVPTDTPSIQQIKADFNAFLEEALANRPDIQQAKINLEKNNIEVRYSRNQLLPELNLNAYYYTTGAGGDQLITVGSPFTGDYQVIGVIEKDVWETLQETLSNLYKNYSISLNLKIPLSFATEKAQLAQARLNLKSAMLNLKKTENSIYSDVKNIIRALEMNEKLVEADKISQALEERKLKAEEKKYSVGLVSNYDVLQKQRDLILAQTNLLNSLKNYSLAVADVNRKLARTFKVYDIKFDDYTGQK